MKRKQRVFPIGTGSITTSGGNLTDDVRINDTQADSISGIAIISDRPDQVQARGRIRIEISGEVIFEDRIPARLLLMGGNNVRPDERIFTRMGDIPYGNGIMTVRYLDVNTAAVPFAAYTVDVVLEYSLKDKS